MVVTMDALERDGLAERRPSPTDRRARIIAVTDAGAHAGSSAAMPSSPSSTPTSSSHCPDEQREPFVSALQGLMAGAWRSRPMCSTTVRRTQVVLN